LTLGFRIKRVYAVGVDVFVTFVGAIYFMLISDGFYGPFITFISVLAVPLTAWLGVFMTDMIKRKTYDAASIMNVGNTSRYWYTGGVNWYAFASWAAGIVVGFLFTAITVDGDVIYTGPLSGSWIGDNGHGWVASIVNAAGLYLVTGGARRTETVSR
jgi:cytosine/uracil/thiamine/allantoin permease